jgi:hypothetical protein
MEQDAKAKLEKMQPTNEVGYMTPEKMQKGYMTPEKMQKASHPCGPFH